MKISIYSRKSIEKLLEKDFPENAVVISFYDPPGKFRDAEYRPVDYSAKTNCVFQVALHDIDLAVLPKYHLTYETYFPEVDDLAEFIFNAKKKEKISSVNVNMAKAEVQDVRRLSMNISIKTVSRYLLIIDIIRIRWCITRCTMHLRDMELKMM